MSTRAKCFAAMRCELAHRYAAAGCDLLSLGDECQPKQTMMMRVETWREFLKPRLAQVIQKGRLAPGLGGASCGPGTWEQYLINPGEFNFRFRRRPFKAGEVDPVLVSKPQVA